MKKYYDVTVDYIVKREITMVIEALSEEEALEKAKEWDCIDSDEDWAPEEGIETENWKVLGESDYQESK